MLGENTATAYHSGREFARCSRYMLSPDCSLWPLKVRLDFRHDQRGFEGTDPNEIAARYQDWVSVTSVCLSFSWILHF